MAIADTVRLLGLVAAGLVSAGVIWRYLVRGGIRGIRRLAHLVIQTEQAAEVLLAELRPNGGSSLRDRVARIDETLHEFITYQHQRNHDLANAIMQRDPRAFLQSRGIQTEGGSHEEPK
jgi:hypothetical protein